VAYLIRIDLVPIVYVRVTGAHSDQEMAQHLEHAGQLMAMASTNGKRLVVIVDVSEAAPLPARQRKMQADFFTGNGSVVGKQVIGIAYVVPSAVGRGILTAIFWLARLPVPRCVTKTLDEALAWAIARCNDAKLPVPDRLRQVGAASLLTDPVA
jgi:hypothetical protein